MTKQRARPSKDIAANEKTIRKLAARLAITEAVIVAARQLRDAALGDELARIPGCIARLDAALNALPE